MLPIRPGMLIHVLFSESRGQPGMTCEKARFAADTGFYRAVEIPEIPDERERADLRRLVEDGDLKLVYWVSFLQLEQPVSISAPDEDERRRAVQALLPQIQFAAECGAHTVGILPGRDVGPERRPLAIQSLHRSILDLAEEGEKHGLQRFEMETMDREAHKKHILGPTDEALRFIAEVRKQVPEFYMAFDTSHLRLLGEDPADSLRKAADVVGQIHLANCVPDPAHPMYGDHHMPLGPPGFLDRAEIVRLFTAGVETGVIGPRAPVVSVEVAAPGGEASLGVEREIRTLLQDVAADMGWTA